MKIEIEQIIIDHFDRKLSLGEAVTKILRLCNVSGWVAYDCNKPGTRPKAYGKYFVCRKDGKIHWETWNGSGWAYNEKVITHWQEVEPPSH
ncbi:MAG: hypothetical protein EP332_06410 [Bacteroidetes bacterium]|nr:MAG: hypothetical protein EP332_06410 [Bacteroidota bacterium]